MSVYKDKKEWRKWNEMVLNSLNAIEDFRDFADDVAIVRADKKIQSLRSKKYNLERQLEEAREALISIRGVLPNVYSSDREIHEIINKVLKDKEK